MYALILFFITAKLNIMIKMSEQRDDGSDVIDVFRILANSSNCNKAIPLDGELGVATILFKYELSCANMSTCQPVPNISLAACSKISDIHTHKHTHTRTHIHTHTHTRTHIHTHTHTHTHTQMSFTVNACMHVYMNKK